VNLISTNIWEHEQKTQQNHEPEIQYALCFNIHCKW